MCLCTHTRCVCSVKMYLNPVHVTLPNFAGIDQVQVTLPAKYVMWAVSKSAGPAQLAKQVRPCTQRRCASRQHIMSTMSTSSTPAAAAAYHEYDVAAL